MKIKEHIAIVAELSKVRITFFVALSASVGFILSGGEIGFNMLSMIIGVFILSCGSSALNHLQEVKTDSLMNRTLNRPLPSGKISNQYAFYVSFGLVSLGLMILQLSSGFESFVLGVLAVIWYNAIYTPLKRKSSMAIMPGALVGAIPPAIGWVAGGGLINDPKLLALGLFFFIWQIPHFWFLLLIYDKDYQRAGFPTLTEIFSEEQLKRITYIWIVALVATGMLIPYFGMTNNLITNLILLLSGIAIVWRTRNLVLKFDENFNLKLAFLDINIYVLIVVITLSIDKFFN